MLGVPPVRETLARFSYKIERLIKAEGDGKVARALGVTQPSPQAVQEWIRLGGARVRIWDLGLSPLEAGQGGAGCIKRKGWKPDPRAPTRGAALDSGRHRDRTCWPRAHSLHSSVSPCIAIVASRPSSS
jgi:hypothetical protein